MKWFRYEIANFPKSGSILAEDEEHAMRRIVRVWRNR